MSDPLLTTGDLVESLKRQGLLDDAGGRSIAEFIASPRNAPELPWFVQGLIAAGAWVAAMCFFAFCAIAKIISESEALIPVGLVLIAGATALRHFFRNLFVAQFCLAVSVAGHAMVLIGAGERSRGLGAAAVASVALCAGLYPLYRDTLHRFLSVCSAIALVAGWIVISHAPPDTLHVLVLGEVAGLALLFTRFSTARGTRPLAYALAASLPWTLFLFAVADFRIGAADWPSRIILGAAFVALVVWAAGGIASLSREPIRLAVGAAILLSLVGISGVLASLGLLILGYARWDRFLLALGGAWLPAFLFAYYYDLKVDLLQKSIWLGASGAVMLAACAVISMRPWARREAA